MLFNADKKLKILTVDDEELNLDILNEYLEQENYDIITAVDGNQAWLKLNADPDIEIIVLDRMMPNMDGMTLLKKIKQIDKFKNIPVIMQTAATSIEQIKEGIEAGASYYLSKPYRKDLLLSVVKSAANDARKSSTKASEINSIDDAMGLLRSGVFNFKTLNDIKALSVIIAKNCLSDKNVLWGLTELMLNAVEHGNLSITYDEKKYYLIKNRWEEEISRRLEMDEYKHNMGTLEFERCDNEITIIISDQGKGFKWNDYLKIDPARITDPNGRGIALSKEVSFDKMQFEGIGNIVRCQIKI